MKCIIIDDDEACRNVLVHLVKQIDDLQLVGNFSSPTEALGAFKKETIDLVFLDIEMPEMNGIEMIKSIGLPPTIITTTHKEYAIDAFEYNVIDYLIKPIALPRFLKAVEKAKKTTKTDVAQGTVSKEFFFIKKDSILNKVPFSEILRVEALGDYLAVHTTNNKKYVVHLTLKAIDDKLPKEKFVRVHRSHIVNIANVGMVEDNTIYVNNEAIPVGALYKEKFNSMLNLL